MSPTPAQLRTLRVYVVTGSVKAAADALGVRVQTVKNHLHQLHRRLGVTSTVEALDALGWLRIPAESGEVHEEAARLRRGKIIRVSEPFYIVPTMTNAIAGPDVGHRGVRR